MDLSASIIIERPVEDVFAYVIDVEHDARWRSGVTRSELVSPPPLSEGSEGQTQAGKTVVRWRVVTFEAGRRVDWELLDGPIRGNGGYRVEPRGAHTLFTLHAEVHPSGLFRLVGPLFGLIGRRQNRKDVAVLKQLMER